MDGRIRLNLSDLGKDTVILSFADLSELSSIGSEYLEWQNNC
jgi:hypothetical protein